MKKNKDILKIINNAVLQFYSYSAAPYTVSFPVISEKIRSVLYNSSDSYTDIILISLWEDYTKDDVEDYLKFSQEYLSIDTPENKRGFLDYRVTQIFQDKTFEVWKQQHASFALGIVINSIKSFGYQSKFYSVDELEPEIKKELASLSGTNLKQHYAIVL
ncbi:MAG: hypothetical protein J7574_09975 [Flavobacterium sp.]|uniref:hypothetical protein n=1 Tax=Flavobacterium sp. TaxID=239 RepID=UPI001B200E8D|nr:hypothetical protein [Flavobacterium sp.]MBO9584473.1 hypothetical protein [Flavobacterium sp.]